MILRINYDQLQQSNSQNPLCSITLTQFISCSAAAPIMFNYSRVILRIHHAQVHPYSLSAAQQLPAAQLQQSNSQNQLCTITPTQFISCSAAAQQLLNYSRAILRNQLCSIR